MTGSGYFLFSGFERAETFEARTTNGSISRTVHELPLKLTGMPWTMADLRSDLPNLLRHCPS